jgi:hypothetical protein
MTITLNSVSTGKEHFPDIISNYTLQHTNGGRDGTTLTLSLQVTQSVAYGTTVAKITDLAPKVTGDTEASLDKLAEWLERAALAIKNRGTPALVVPATYTVPGSTA